MKIRMSWRKLKDQIIEGPWMLPKIKEIHPLVKEQKHIGGKNSQIQNLNSKVRFCMVKMVFL